MKKMLILVGILKQKDKKHTTKYDVLLAAAPHIRRYEKRKPHTIKVWDGNGYKENTYI